jgi:hypothetical protein
MSTQELKALLDQVPDTREFVLRARGSTSRISAAHEAWSDARDDTSEALASWLHRPRRERYIVYRAAQDREDAAQDALAEAGRVRR